MAALSLLPALLLLAPLRVEVADCDAHFSAQALERQLRLEWPAPPDGTRVRLRCRPAVDLAPWELTLEAIGRPARSEFLVLPALSAESRVRVLALIVTERGRALATSAAPTETLPPTPAPSDPLATEAPSTAPREPLVASALSTTPRSPLTRATPAGEVIGEEVPAVAPGPSSPLRRAVLTARLTDEEPAPWRVGLGAGSLTPLWLGPWRFGPQLRIQRGFLGVSVSTTWGSRRVPSGTVSPFAVTVEPELTLGCVSARWWQVCGGTRGVFGYGAIGASSTVPGVTTARVDGPLLGGGAQLGASVRLASWLAVDLDGVVGGTWGVFGSSDRTPVAALGGSFAGALLSVSASWGAQ